MAARCDVAYGKHVVSTLLARRTQDVHALYVLADEAGADSALLAQAKAAGIPLRRVGRDALDQLAEGGVHQGVVAEVTPFAYAPLAAVSEGAQAALVLVLDQVQDPRNFGALVRSAAAFGASGVVVPQDRSAPMSSVAVKASAGAAYLVPVVQAKNLRRALDQLSAAGLWRCGLTTDADKSLSACDFGLPSAIVVGAEGHGLRRLTRETCDVLAHIPARGLESLNASVAGSVALYEASRQRLRA